MLQHESWCFYPSDPCSCRVLNENERRTTHESWCDYPSGPCDCKLKEADSHTCKDI